MSLRHLLGGTDRQALLDAIDRSQAVIEFDLTGKILSANENFCKVMGYSAAEIVGQHHRLFVSPEEAASPSYRPSGTACRRPLRQGPLLSFRQGRQAGLDRSLLQSGSASRKALQGGEIRHRYHRAAPPVGRGSRQGGGPVAGARHHRIHAGRPDPDGEREFPRHARLWPRRDRRQAPLYVLRAGLSRLRGLSQLLGIAGQGPFFLRPVRTHRQGWPARAYPGLLQSHSGRVRKGREGREICDRRDGPHACRRGNRCRSGAPVAMQCAHHARQALRGRAGETAQGLQQIHRGLPADAGARARSHPRPDLRQPGHAFGGRRSVAAHLAAGGGAGNHVERPAAGGLHHRAGRHQCDGNPPAGAGGAQFRQRIRHGAARDRRGHAPHRKGLRRDRHDRHRHQRDRLPDQSSGAECRCGSGPRR